MSVRTSNQSSAGSAQRQPHQCSSSTAGGNDQENGTTEKLRLKDPKKLAEINYFINHMKKEDIVQQLSIMRLDTQGNKDRVKKRLKLHFKKEKAFLLTRQPKKRQPVYDRHYDFLCVLDFECTCEDGVYDYAHEIIEFPVFLVKTATLEIVDEFHAYCKPQLHPDITPFASELTGISQETLDSSRSFLDVLDDFNVWLEKHRLGTENRYAILSDGPWDMGKFFQMQCLISGLPSVPHQFRYWINIRRSFNNMYANKNGRDRRGSAPAWKNLQGMLDSLGMEFEGRPHCGRDDARNIARIAIRMLIDGVELRVNERLLRRDRADVLNEKRQQKMAERDRQKELEASLRTSPSPSAPPQTEGEPLDDPHVEAKEEEETEPLPDASGRTEEIKAEAEKRERENAERRVWRELFPYKVVSVSKQEFLMDLFEDCQTCSDPDSEDDTV